MIIKKRTGLAVILMCSLVSSALGQDIPRFYVDYYEKETTQEKAVYWYTVYKKNAADTLWQREMHHKMTNSPLASVGYCKDSNGLVKQGEYIYYNSVGKRTRKCNYDNGKKSGLFQSWHADSTIASEHYYKNDVMVNTNISRYKGGKICDSFPLDDKGAGKGWGYYEDGNKRYEGYFANGVKDGEWFYYYDAGGETKSMSIVFEKDSVKQTNCFTQTGEPQNGDCIYEKEASFPGGQAKWASYLIKNLGSVKCEKYMPGPGKYQVIVKFIVGKDGDISDAEIENPGSIKELDKKALAIIKNSPKWLPAIQYNQPVKAYRRQPVTFVTE